LLERFEEIAEGKILQSAFHGFGVALRLSGALLALAPEGQTVAEFVAAVLEQSVPEDEAGRRGKALAFLAGHPSLLLSMPCREAAFFLTSAENLLYTALHELKSAPAETCPAAPAGARRLCVRGARVAFPGVTGQAARLPASPRPRCARPRRGGAGASLRRPVRRQTGCLAAAAIRRERLADPCASPPANQTPERPPSRPLCDGPADKRLTARRVESPGNAPGDSSNARPASFGAAGAAQRGGRAEPSHGLSARGATPPPPTSYRRACRPLPGV
jgi:hypothetical protein